MRIDNEKNNACRRRHPWQDRAAAGGARGAAEGAREDRTAAEEGAA